MRCLRRFSAIALSLSILFSASPLLASDSDLESQGLPPQLLEEIRKLVDPDAGSNDQFGHSVAIDGDTAIVGAWTSAVAGPGSGAVYVFERNHEGTDNWGRVVKIHATDGGLEDRFGVSVSISGDTIVVGAHLDDDACSDNSACESGAAYVFERDQPTPNNWGEIKKLTASDATAGDFFGASVSISGDTIAVGADGIANGGQGSGAVYIFERDLTGPLWGQARKITASDLQTAVHFGLSVSLDEDTLAIGSTSGVVYMFGRDRDGAELWGEITPVTASNAGQPEGFGQSVALDGDTLVVGAASDDEGCFNSSCGSAFVFSRNSEGAENWGEVAKLQASEFSTDARFGNSVAIDGDAIVVGAFRDNDGSAGASGASYLFSRSLDGSETWSEVEKLKASDAEAGDEFGISVALDHQIAIVGAHFNQDVCCSSGSAYVFELSDLLSEIFSDGFESGDTSAWPITSP